MSSGLIALTREARTHVGEAEPSGRVEKESWFDNRLATAKSVRKNVQMIFSGSHPALTCMYVYCMYAGRPYYLLTVRLPAEQVAVRYYTPVRT